MSTTALGDMLRYMRLTFEAQAEREVSDVDLLERFRSQRDEAAFAVLVHRHGPMVLAVGRRVTGDAHEAEDVYQATFLATARRAGSIGRKGNLGGWLYAVAQSIAVRAKAKAIAQKRLERERRAQEMQQAEPLDELTWQELRSVLDEELARLPEKYRTPLVLCYLEGKSHDRAAKELGCPRTSLASRLSRAKELLHGQLVRRGVALSVAALATALTKKASGAPVAAKLVVNTLKAALGSISGQAAAGTWASANAMALAEEALTGMIVVKAKLVLIVLALGLTAVGAGVTDFSGLTGTEHAAKPEGMQPPQAKIGLAGQPKTAPALAVDLDGDPLPVGAVGRLGTTRFRAGQFTQALAFAPDGKVLAWLGSHGSFEGGIWFLDAANGRALHRLSISQWDWYMALSPDGKLLFTGGTGSTIFNSRLVEVASGKVIRHLENPNDRLQLQLGAVAYSPDGHSLASAGWDQNGSRVLIWDAATGKLVKDYKGNAEDSSWTIAFSPDSKTIATAGHNKSIRLCDVATGKTIRRLEGTENEPVRFLVFAKGGKGIASLADDWTIRIWDVEMGQLLHSLKGDMATTRTMALSPDGRLLASGGRNGVIHLWNIDTQKVIRAWQAHQTDINSLAFSPDSKMLASTGQFDRAIRRWETATGKEIEPIAGHTGAVELLRFAPDGQAILSCGSDIKVVEWDLKSFRQTDRLFGGAMGPTKDGWHSAAFDLSPDGKTLAVVGRWWTEEMETNDPVMRFFEVATGKEVRKWEFPDKGYMRTLRFSPNGKFLVSVSGTATRLWDVASGQELPRPTETENIYPATFSPDSNLLALTDSETKVGKAIRLWDIAAGKEIRRWDSRQWHVENLLFTPDGKALVSTPLVSGTPTDRADLRVWSTETGAALAQLGGLEGDSKPYETRMTAVAFSASGQLLATGVSRETRKMDSRTSFCKIHLFEMISGKEIRQFDVPQGSIYSLAFSPDGRTLAAGGADSTILLWDLTGHAHTGAPRPAALTAKDTDLLWSQLGEDATKADQAIWALVFSPKQSLPLVKARMQVVPASADLVAKLVADLDSDQFAVRQKAFKVLDDLGESAEAALRKTLAANSPLEVRQRLEQILEKRDKDAIRKLRAIETLEHIGTAEARDVLRGIARSAPNPKVAEAAAAAITRVGKRLAGIR